MEIHKRETPIFIYMDQIDHGWVRSIYIAISDEAICECGCKCNMQIVLM